MLHIVFRTKKYFAFLLLWWGLGFPFVSVGQSHLDSLNLRYSQSKSDTEKITLLSKIASAYSKVDSNALALSYAKQEVQLAASINNPKRVAESNVDLANKYWALTQNDSAVFCMNKALNYYEKQAASVALVKAYNTLGNIYRDWTQTTLASDNYTKGLSAAHTIKDSADMVTIYFNLGFLYSMNDEYDLSREQCMHSIEVAIPMKRYRSAINSYNLIGSMYAKQGLSAEAAKTYFAALEINSKYLHEDNISAVLDANMGNVYNEMRDSTMALKYYREALIIFSKAKDRKPIAQILGNMGNTYMETKDYKNAEVYELKSLEQIKLVGDKHDVASCYTNVGEFYNHTGQYDKALDYYNTAMELQDELEDKEGLTYVTSGLSQLYQNKGDYNKAQEYGIRAFKYANEVQLLGQVRDEAKSLSEIFDKLHQPDKAYYYYKRYIEARDSLENKEESKKLINAELSHKYEEKQQADMLEHVKQQAIADEKEKREGIIRNIYLTAFIVVLLLTGLLFRNLIRIRKSKQIITEQKIEVELQKSIVDQKNKDITDSIRYASRIQRALLTTQEYVSKQVKDHFILFKPRDIVSGDFYWAFKAPPNTSQSGNGDLNEALYIACCDCTGHGVPGAFMSLLNISMLNETVIERKIAKPQDILNEIRNNIIKALNPEKADTESKDGMDCSLCAIDFKNKKMQLACANNPVWIVRGNNEFIEIMPDKMPVGIQYGDQKSFTLHTVDIKEGDSIYLFTDGYADQFGGPKGKKFKYKQLQEIVIANVGKSMNDQKNILEKTITDWMGNLEQIDDMLIIGIKV